MTNVILDIVTGLQWNIHHKYKTQISSLCYGTRDDQFGKFHLKHSGYLVELILKHKSGNVTCTVTPVEMSYWGCNLINHINMIVTDKNNNVIFPSIKQINKFMVGRWYFLPGFQGNSDVLVFTTDYVSRPKYIEDGGQEIRIWYGEDLVNSSESDNSGTHCVEVISTILQYFYVKE